jgi:hypothetical protein
MGVARTGSETRAICEGDACDVIQVSWDPHTSVYRVANLGGKAVRVTLSCWSEMVRIRLEPGASQTVNISEFEHPYCADYCD